MISKEIENDTTICDVMGCNNKVVSYELRHGGAIGLCEDHKCPYDCEDCINGIVDCSQCIECGKEWAKWNFNDSCE